MQTQKMPNVGSISNSDRSSTQDNAKRGLVLVTGATGFIGESLCRKLAQEFSVVALDLKPLSQSIENVEFVKMDVSSDSAVRGALESVVKRYGQRIASVVHLAAYYSFSGRPSSKYDEITVRGTERLLNALKNYQVEQFVFSSTMLVHAPRAPEEGEVDERTPIAPKWDYPRSKVDAERIIHEQRGDIPAVNLRIAGVYSDRGHSIPIANQIQRIFERQISAHLYPADASHGQAFIHIDDLVEAIYLTVKKRTELPAEVSLLIGEPETMSYQQLQNTIGLLLHGKKWRTQRIPKLIAKVGAWAQGHIPFMQEPFIKPFMIDLASDHYDLDIAQASRHLGWNPRRKLSTTLPSIIASLKENPQHWYRENKLHGPAWGVMRARRLGSVILPGILVGVGLYSLWVFRKRRSLQWARS